MRPPITALVFLASAVLASASLISKHSKEFPLRYEGDVVPTLAGWALNPGSTIAAAQSSNSWLSFVTSSPQISAYRNSQWNVAANQAYTAEIRYRTPRQGHLRLDVDDGGAFRDTLFISSTGLLWNDGATATLISATASNAIHVVRIASWSDQGLRMVQIWHNGSSVYGPALNLTASSNTGAIIVWGDVSSIEQSDVEIDYLRMIIGGAYAPFVSQLGINRNLNAVAVSWTMSPKSVFQLQTTDNLTGSSWLNLGARISVTIANSTAIVNPTGASGFYRIQEIVEGALNQPFTPGSPPTCLNLPAFQCVANCLDLVSFSPVSGSGYEDFPVNGETPNDQYRSFVRREVRQAIQFAAAKVECQTGHWPFGNNRPVGLGDMSEANGSIPGTRDGNPGHPAGTHQNGRDIDVAYYQLDTANNNLRAICESRIGGVDQFHCVAAPNILDVWRTALFIGILIEHPRLRVIGVDGQVGPLIVQAVGQLSQAGWLSASAPAVLQQKLAFETTDGGRGWYYFHHQYMHISFMN